MANQKIEIELEKAEAEIEELAMQLSDMLGAALYFAGAKKEDLQKAIDAYLQGLDEVLDDEEDDDSEMGLEEIIEVIEHIKRKNPKLFGR
ncbi:MAG: hypothetical protein PHN38_05830 [Sulfurospirillaceae bacterium]|nr:hypothetical protein [Sulfurospirillaceae bacterium]MDD3462932.1 hypothetical protein [Sulfurospirillaceae bacterium]